MATRAFITTFRQEALAPLEQWQWDSIAARQFRYLHASHYYNNTVYTDLARYAAQHRNKHKLYRHIRAIYNPVARLVDIYPDKVYGGSLDFETLATGAIPLVGLDEALATAIGQLWRWSNWQNAKSLYVRHGALFGDSVIKVVDDRVRAKVRLEVMHPAKLAEAQFDAVGNVKACRIQFEREDPETGRRYLYDETIDQESFATFRDGQPWAYYPDVNGDLVSEWTNEYGFVPLVVTRHKEIGFDYGENAFQPALPKIDELNDAASYLNDQVRKSVRALWGVFGASAKTEVDATSEERLGAPMIYFPEGSDAKPLVAPLDLAAATENLREMLLELERDMPELALHRVREQAQMTAPGVRAGWSDAIGRLTEARGNYDGGLVRAQMMAISIGGLGGYENFERFGLDDYARGNLEHYVAERPVIDDSLSQLERVTALQTVSGQPPAVAGLMLAELGYGQDVIGTVQQALREQQERAVRDAVRGFAEGVFGNVLEVEEQGNGAAT